MTISIIIIIIVNAHNEYHVILANGHKKQSYKSSQALLPLYLRILPS